MPGRNVICGTASVLQYKKKIFDWFIRSHSAANTSRIVKDTLFYDDEIMILNIILFIPYLCIAWAWYSGIVFERLIKTRRVPWYLVRNLKNWRIIYDILLDVINQQAIILVQMLPSYVTNTVSWHQQLHWWLRSGICAPEGLVDTKPIILALLHTNSMFTDTTKSSSFPSWDGGPLYCL